MTKTFWGSCFVFVILGPKIVGDIIVLALGHSFLSRKIVNFTPL